MKQYIVLIGMIALGVFLYGLIMGPGSDGNSVVKATGTSMRSAMESGIGGSVPVHTERGAG